MQNECLQYINLWSRVCARENCSWRKWLCMVWYNKVRMQYSALAPGLCNIKKKNVKQWTRH